MALRALLAALAGATLAPLATFAQPPAPPAAGATTVDGVVVTPSDKSLNQRAHGFVNGIVAQRPQRSLIRWRRPICPLVAGLPPDQGEYMLARLSEVAREARAPLGGRDCRANLYVVVSDEPQRLLELWRRHDRNLFAAGLPATVARFVETDRPVRVWHNWLYEHPDGRPAPPSASDFGAPTFAFSKASRLSLNAVRSAGAVIVVVDARELDGVTPTQLADYVAMSAFTELRPELALGDGPTILSLFDENREAPPGLSAWDKAFLRGLYGTDSGSVTQRAEIAGRVLRDVRQAETPPR